MSIGLLTRMGLNEQGRMQRMKEGKKEYELQKRTSCLMDQRSGRKGGINTNTVGSKKEDEMKCW